MKKRKEKKKVNIKQIYARALFFFVCVTRQKKQEGDQEDRFLVVRHYYIRIREICICCRVSAAFLLFVYPFSHTL